MTSHSLRSTADWTRLSALVAIWGTAFLFIGLAVETLPPASLVAIRVAIAAGVLLAAVRVVGLALPPPGMLWIRFALLACVGNAIPFVAISWGQQRVASGLAGILMAVMPLATLLLAHRFVPGERLTLRKATGFAVGFAGVVVLTGEDALARLGGDPSDIARHVAILAGAVCYAINTILARRMPPLHPLVSSAGVMLMASSVMVPAALFFDAPWRLAPSALSLASAVWLGLVATGVATVIYFQIVSTAGPTFLSLMNYVIPAVAFTAGIALLGEPFEWRAVLALALILSGLYTSQTGGPPAPAGAATRDPML